MTDEIKEEIVVEEPETEVTEPTETPSEEMLPAEGESSEVLPPDTEAPPTPEPEPLPDPAIGVIYVGTYPPSAAVWCNANNCYIEELEPLEGMRRFEIKEIPAETEEQRQARFEATFINTSWGWYRKQPQGYANAPQSVDIILNMVNALDGFTEQIANLMIFYTQPDFSIPEQCTEGWLVANQYKHDVATKEEFLAFYIDFQARWAQEQYKSEIIPA